MSQQAYNANDVLMGGKSSPTWKFEQPIAREGVIAAPPQAKQEREYDPNNPGGGDLKYFPSGDPIMGVVVEVQTDDRDPSIEDDDGRRTFYIEGKYLKQAVRDGVRAAGASGLEVGGKLRVEFTHREDPMDKRSRKFWQVTYTPAGNAALMADQPAQAQAAAAPQQAAPAAAPSAGPDPKDVETAKSLIAAGLADDVIAASCPSLPPTVIAALRNAA